MFTSVTFHRVHHLQSPEQNCRPDPIFPQPLSHQTTAKVAGEGVDTVMQKSSRSSGHQSSRHRSRDKSRERDQERERDKDWPPEKLSDSHSPVSDTRSQAVSGYASGFEPATSSLSPSVRASRSSPCASCCTSRPRPPTRRLRPTCATSRCPTRPPRRAASQRAGVTRGSAPRS